MIDYQWPNPLKGNRSSNFFSQSEIEFFFKEIFKKDVILVPSGRAALSIILNFYNISRKDKVYAPLWTSHCVWDVITRIANPSTVLNEDNDVVIAVHKWGEVEKIDKQEIKKSIIIEDSVDSIIEDNCSLFPNDGQFEIFSLPKIIGSFTGGLIVVKNTEDYIKIKSTISENLEFAKYQSRLRYGSSFGENEVYASWSDLEYKNTGLDEIALRSISENLENYLINSTVIKERITKVSERFDEFKISFKRLPPVLTFDIERYKVNEDSNFMIRNRKINGEYKKVYLLPVHFGVNDTLFEKLFDSISFV